MLLRSTFEGIFALLSTRIIVSSNLFRTSDEKAFQSVREGTRGVFLSCAAVIRVVPRIELRRRGEGMEGGTISTNFPRLLPSRRFPVVNHTLEYICSAAAAAASSRKNRKCPGVSERTRRVCVYTRV